MGWQTDIFPLLIVTSGGGFTGQFNYSPGPGANNLIASIAAAGGTDPYGNVYLAGIVEYAKIGATFVAVQLNNGIIEFWTATTEAGPWSLHVTEKYNTVTGNLELGPPGAPTFTIADNVLSVANQSLVQLQVQGGVVAIVGGVAETFHPLALVNGWTGTVRYQLLPDGRVELDVVLSSAAATVAQFGTMPAGYRPSATRNVAMGATANVAAGQAPYVSVTATGVASVNGLAAFSAAGTFVGGGSYPLN